MAQFEYKVIPAPKRLKKVKGVRSTPELLALTLTDAINEMARQGWEYVRAEELTAEEAGGWFRRGSEVTETVLIFRRRRPELVEPRLAPAAPEPKPVPEPRPEPLPNLGLRAAPAERPVSERASDRAAERVERLPASMVRRPTIPRSEPRLGDRAEPGTVPLRPGPRLGPADKV